MKKEFLFLSIILLFGCKNDNSIFTNHFTLNNSFEICFDELNDINFYLYHFEEESIISFQKNNDLIALDLKTGEEVFNFHIPSNKGFLYRDHLVHNQDSIFICSIINNDMYILLLNNKGEIYNKWDIGSQTHSIYNGYFFIDSDYSHPMAIINDRLYFKGSYHLKPGSKIAQKVPILISLDLHNGTIKQLGDIPFEYKQGQFYGNHQYDYSRVFNERSEMIISFPSSHNLFVYDTSGHLIKIKNCKSKFVENIEPINKEDKDQLAAIIDAYGYNAQYSDLVYDEYNNMYYRIVLHELEKNDINNKKNDVRKRNWSIMVLDSNLNIKSEIKMPLNQFWKRIHITEQGLLMKSSDNNANKFKIYKLCIK